MQYAGMTFIIAILALVWLFDLFIQAALGVKLLLLSPLLWSLGMLLWAVYMRLGGEIRRRRLAGRNRRIAG